MIRRLGALGVALLVALGLAAVPAQAHPAPATPRPVVFVHGSAGSGQQFQTQAKRFAVNGYPIDLIEAHEYDSTFTLNTMADVWAGLDARIIRLLQTSGQQQIDLLAHSLGTFVVQGYLNSSPERAARVANYVNLDGRTAEAPPGGVRTLAIWGEGDQSRTVAGATNTYLPEQGHTETVTSPESFQHSYRFFTDRSPQTTAIGTEARIQLAGRAVLFPQNAGVSAGSLEVYELNELGLRTRRVATVALSGDGSFGPITAKGGAGTSSRSSAQAPPCTTSTSNRSAGPTSWSGCSPARPAAVSVRWWRRVTGTRRSWSTATRSGGVAATGSGSTATTSSTRRPARG